MLVCARFPSRNGNNDDELCIFMYTLAAGERRRNRVRNGRMKKNRSALVYEIEAENSVCEPAD